MAIGVDVFASPLLEGCGQTIKRWTIGDDEEIMNHDGV